VGGVDAEMVQQFREILIRRSPMPWMSTTASPEPIDS
jgi:hypothetical protein